MRIFSTLLLSITILAFYTFSFVFSSFALSPVAMAETKSFQILQWPPGFGWGTSHKQYREMKRYNPYLEDARHSQHLQYKDEDWYVEDWLAQEDGMSLIKKFYEADIFKDQVVGHASLPELVVGPNFYRLSGLDKRRAVALLDTVYGVTDKSENASFILSDWYSKKQIGVFDSQGLRLH